MSQIVAPVTEVTHTPSYEELLEENRRLKERIQSFESTHTTATTPSNSAIDTQPSSSAPSSWSHSLTPSQISRYSRQLILSEFGGADTQRKLLAARVLIVGAGGLGAPAALYLAAAGIGHLILVDGDRVELSNLHRQVIHTESRIGWFKAESAKLACQQLNSDVRVTTVCERFTELNAIQLAEQADIIVDASDNVATRYLCNDAALVCGKVLVSGSALRLEGQVSVFGLYGGPCYRCLYPKPPPPETVTNCSDGGVLGAVTGIIGSIQALEVIKIVGGLIAHDSRPQYPLLSATSTDFDPSAAAATLSTCNTKLLLFDGCSASFRSVKLRGRNKECVVCGDAPTITKQTLESRSFDYQLFCGSTNHDGPKSLTQQHYLKVPQASVLEYQQATLAASAHSAASSSSPSPAPLLIDVREPVQYRICALPNAVNVPLRVLKREIPAWLKHILHPSRIDTNSSSLSIPAATVQSTTPHPGNNSTTSNSSTTDALPPSSSVPARDIYVICRRGFDSIAATRLLLAELHSHSSTTSDASSTTSSTPIDSTSLPTTPDSISIRNVSGGLQSWTEKVDPNFPLY